MSTVIASPDFCTVPIWRKIVLNNEAIHGVDFLLVTNETWLPKIMADCGFFTSGSQCKKNRPDLWRNVVDNEWFKFGGWCRIRVCLIGYDPEGE
jgi:hypothetical protein